MPSTAALPFTFSIAPGTDHAGARNTIRDQLVTNAGWTVVSSYAVSTSEYATFTVPGMVGYVSLRVYAAGGGYYVAVSLHETFNAGTNARGTEATTPVTPINATGQTGSLLLLVHPEMIYLRSSFGSSAANYGLILLPTAERPAWWAAGVPYAILTYFTNAAANLYSLNGSPILARTGVTQASPDGRNLTQRLTFFAGNRLAGQTSADLGLLAAQGVAVLDTGAVGGKTYTVIEGGNESMVLRTA